MSFFRTHPLLLAFLITAVGTLAGTFVALLYGIYTTQNIAEETLRLRPNDPLDGLPIIVLGCMILGFIISFFLSGLVAILAVSKIGSHNVKLK